MKHVRRTHLATGALAVLTAGILATTGASSAQADTTYAWVTTVSYACSVTGGGHPATTEDWDFTILIDDNAETWKIGQPVPAQYVSIDMAAPKKSFTRARGVTSLHGPVAFHYTLGDIPIMANLSLSWTQKPAPGDDAPQAFGKGQAFTPTHAGEYRGKLGAVTGDLTTNTGDTRHLSCTLKSSEDSRTGALYVEDPNATPTPKPTTTTAPKPSSSSTAAPAPKPSRPTTPDRHPGGVNPSRAPHATPTHATSPHSRPAPVATPHGPSVQTDHVATSTAPPALAPGIAVGTLVAGAAGLTLVRRRRSN